MKRTTLYTTLIVLVTASILSSCSFLQKGEFADRKYYNFPRSKHDVTQTASVKEQPSEVVPVVVVKDNENDAPAEVTASIDTREVIVSAPEKTVLAEKETVVNTVSEEETTEAAAPEFKKSDFRKEVKKVLRNRDMMPNNSSLMIFLAVVASIFFPPLGIYIKDHRTNKWFWITLLLCLAAGGITFVYTGGAWAIFWIIAVVIALMNVFDIL